MTSPAYVFGMGQRALAESDPSLPPSTFDLVLQASQGFVAIFQDEDSLHGEPVQGIVTSQGLCDGARLFEPRSAGPNLSRKIDFRHGIAPFNDCLNTILSLVQLHRKVFLIGARLASMVDMPTPFELLKVADLVKLAADTAKACSEMQANGHMARIHDIALRIKAAGEELEAVGREMKDRPSRRDH